MQLPQIDVVHAEPVERPMQVVARVFRGSRIRFGSEKEMPRLALEPWADAQLCIAVAGRGVDVIDAVPKQYLERAISHVLAHARQRSRAEKGPTALMSRAPEARCLDRHTPGFGISPPATARTNLDGRTLGLPRAKTPRL